MGYPPGGHQGYGYPQQQPGYGYPQQQPGYGYPQQQPGHGYLPPDQAARQMRGRRRRRIAALVVLVLTALPWLVSVVPAAIETADLARYGRAGTGDIVTLPQGEVAVSIESGPDADLETPEVDVTLAPQDGGPPVSERLGEPILFGIVDYTATEQSTDQYTRRQIGQVDVPRPGPYGVQVTERAGTFGVGDLLFGEHKPFFGFLPASLVLAWTLIGLLLCAILARPRRGYLRGILRIFSEL